MAYNPKTGNMWIAAKGVNGNSIWVGTFNGKIFNNDWRSIPGATPSTPVLVYNPVSEKMMIVVRGMDNGIWIASFDALSGSFNNDWSRIPGATASAPAAVWDDTTLRLYL